MSATLTVSRKLLIDEAPLIVLPTLAKHIGYKEAVVLQQLHYFLQITPNVIDGVPWIYNTYEQWQEKIPFLSLRTLRRIMTALEAMNLVRSERMEARHWYQRKWYTINYETLYDLNLLIRPDSPIPLGNFDLIDPANLNDSYTKTSLKKFNKTTDTVPTLHPVQEVELKGGNFEAVAAPINQDEEKEGLLEQSGKTGITEQEKSEEKENPLVFSDEGKIDPQLEMQVEEAIAPAPMNPQIKKAVLAASLEAVQDAIAVVQQRKEAGRVKNPAGLFVKAVKEQWKPSGSKTVHDTLAKIPEDFNEWFDLARKKGW
ncbi:MAG: hypothetical protein HC851_22900 [Acaryochloris sp. RU_4_1]|nr:hypothetical protein [Acaryochloris sp. RU_4_1]